MAVKPDDPSVALYIGKVIYLYRNAEKLSKDRRMAHIMWFKSVCFLKIILQYADRNVLTVSKLV